MTNNYSAGSIWSQPNTPTRLLDDKAFQDNAFKVVTARLNELANVNALGALVYNKARNNEAYIRNILTFTGLFVEFGLSMEPGIDRARLLAMCVTDVLDIHAIQELKQPNQSNLQFQISGDAYRYFVNRAAKLQQKMDAVVQRNNLGITMNLQLQGGSGNGHAGVAMNNQRSSSDLMWGVGGNGNSDNGWGGVEPATQRTRSVSELYFDNVALGAGMDSPSRGLNVKTSVIDSLFQDSEKALGNRRPSDTTIQANDNGAAPDLFDWGEKKTSSHKDHGVYDEFNSDNLIQDMEAKPYQEETASDLWDWTLGMDENDADAFDYSGRDLQPAPDHVVQSASKMQAAHTPAAKPQQEVETEQGDRHIKDGWYLSNPDNWQEVFAKAPRNAAQPFNLTLPLKGTRLYRRNTDGTLTQRLVDIPMERFNHNPAELLGTTQTAEEFDEPLRLTQPIFLSDAIIKAEGDKPKRVNSEYLKETADTNKIQSLVDEQLITGFSDAELTVRALARSHKAVKEIKAQGTAGVNVEYTLEKADLLHIAGDADDFLHKVSFLTQGSEDQFKNYLDFALRFIELEGAIHHDVYSKLDKHLLRVVNDFLTYDLAYEGKLALEYSFAGEFVELCEYLNRKDPDALKLLQTHCDELLSRSRIVASAGQTERLRKIFLSRIAKAEYDSALEIMANAVFSVEHHLIIRSGLKADAFGVDVDSAPGDQIVMKQSAYPNTLKMLYSSMARTTKQLADGVFFNIRFITADGFSFTGHETVMADDVLILARR